MPLTKQEKLKKLLEVANEDYVSVKQARELFKALTDTIEKLKGQLKDEADFNRTDLIKKLNFALDKIKSTELSLKSQVKDNEKRQTEKLKDLSDAIDKKLESLRKEIPEATDLTEIWNAINEIVIPSSEEIETNIEKRLPQYAEVFRDALELLNGDERLDQSAIKGLEEKFEEIKKQIPRGSGGGVRRVYQPYIEDLSASTDGATKTFSLSRAPLKTDTILVWGTDFPIILRPTTDFTVTNKSLTLTDEVPAPTQGATLLVQYFA